MEKRGPDVWGITHEAEGDVPGTMPELFFTNPDERPIFHWSFKEFGPLSSALNTNTDVVITTGRVYLYSRSIYKEFDAKTCCCFGACWCMCIKKFLRGPKRLQRTSSFLTLPFLLSFSTEMKME